MYDTPNYAGPPEDRQPVSAVDAATLLRKWLGLIVLVPLVMAGITVAYRAKAETERKRSGFRRAQTSAPLPPIEWPKTPRARRGGEVLLEDRR